jgi:hypothetical protein
MIRGATTSTGTTPRTSSALTISACGAAVVITGAPSAGMIRAVRSATVHWSATITSGTAAMPSASNYLCGCGRFMQCKHNSVTVEELKEDGLPYKLWDADLWECPECGTHVIAGFGKRPIAEHYQSNYAEIRERLSPIYTGRPYVYRNG